MNGREMREGEKKERDLSLDTKKRALNFRGTPEQGPWCQRCTSVVLVLSTGICRVRGTLGKERSGGGGGRSARSGSAG